MTGYRSASFPVDLAVVGAGMAGQCAALFARLQGLSVTVLGPVGAWAYASGLFDLLGVHPVDEGKLVDDPWEAVRAVPSDLPGHPYALVSEQDVRTAFDVLLDAFDQAGYPYVHALEANSDVITSVGTRKRTYCLPRTMWAGVAALRDRVPCLLVDFEGTKDYSARQIVVNASPAWPDLRSVRVRFPGAESLPELSSEFLARRLDEPACRQRLAEVVAPHVGQSKAVGLPPILGFEKPSDALADLERRLGVSVFEVPSTPVSVPGLRVRLAFERWFRERGVRALADRVARAQVDPEGGFVLHAGDAESQVVIRARSVLLATGRFLGGGLVADRHRVREALLDLPVCQPGSRADWHRKDLFDPRGHEINQAGVEVDDAFRPRGVAGGAAFPSLHAAGSILAHQDWMRTKCGSGLAIATAWGAVRSCLGQDPGGKA
jgi:glycerol-3-phosphate dehydrogenase subunit B